jgi:hypothetical protein
MAEAGVRERRDQLRAIAAVLLPLREDLVGLDATCRRDLLDGLVGRLISLATHRRGSTPR